MDPALSRSRRLRRWFWAVAVSTQLAIAGTAAWHLASGGPWQWGGAMLPTVALTGWLGWVVVRDTPRTAPDLPWQPALAGAGVVIAAAASPVAMVLGGIGFALVLAHVLWYSRLGRTPSPRLVQNQTLPLFEVTALDGTPFRSNELRGRPAILLFHPGNWCPISRAQVRELAARAADIGERSADVLCISPQPAAHTARLAARLGAGFRFYADPGCRAASDLGLRDEGGVPFGVLGYGADTVLPTAVVVDGMGVVVYLDQGDNYRVRPEPAALIRVLDTLG